MAYCTLVRCEARSPATTPWSIILRWGGGTETTIASMAAGATPPAMTSLSACVAAMVCRAAHHGLKETSARAIRSPRPSLSAATSGLMPRISGRTRPSNSLRSAVKPCCAANAALSPLRAALPTANQREVVAALWCPTVGAASVSASASACARLLVELKQPRGDGGHAEGRSEIGRPDAAVENGRPVDGAPEPGHGLGAGEDRGDHVAGCDRRQRAGEGERAGNDDGAGRGHGGEMDVVDLAQPRERAAGGEIERPRAIRLCARAHRGAKSQQAQAFDGVRARDQGADGVDEVELDRLAHRLGGTPACGDITAEPFERAHVTARPHAEEHRTQIPSEPPASPRSVSANNASSGSILLIMPCSKV